jgi:MscS family membrane protein
MSSLSTLLQTDHLWDWLIFAVTLVGVFILAPAVIWVVRTVGARLSARSKSTLDDRLLLAALRPLRFVIYTVGLLYAVQVLHDRIDPQSQIKPFVTILNIAESLVILTATNLVVAVTRTAMDWYLHELSHNVADQRVDRELLPLVRRIASLVFYFIAASIILANFGVNITALVTTAGVASLAVALAAQETLSNMLGGFVILVDRPFRVGDVILLANGTSGEVIEIGLRSTRIKLFDGNALVVPNKEMANQSVTNLALPTPQAAIRATLSVDYSTDVEKAKAVLLATLQAHPEVLPDPAPGVWFTTFGQNGLDLFFSCWVASYREKFRITDELNVAILKAFRENGIVVPLPQRTVHLVK